MNILINTKTNPKEIGVEAYNQLLQTLTTKIQNILPNTIIYQPQQLDQSQSDVDKLSNKFIIVPDTFSFGTGGHAKTCTKQLVRLLFCTHKKNITLILLEPNSKNEWCIDLFSQIKFDSIDTFLQFAPRILTLSD